MKSSSPNKDNWTQADTKHLMAQSPKGFCAEAYTEIFFPDTNERILHFSDLLVKPLISKVHPFSNMTLS